MTFVFALTLTMPHMLGSRIDTTSPSVLRCQCFLFASPRDC